MRTSTAGASGAIGRRELLRLGVATGIGLSATALLGACKPQRPRFNVINIVADDMRHDELAWMPNLQAIAALGTVYPRFRVPTPMCNPARAMFLRGQRATGPNGTGITSQATTPRTEVRQDMLPRWLADAGCETGVIGKYFTGATLPQHWEGWSFIRSGAQPAHSNALGYSVWDGTTTVGPVEDVRQEVRWADESIAFIDGATSPWFLWLCSSSPHGPFEPLQSDLDAVADVDWPYVEQDVSSKPSWIRALPAPTSSDVAYMRAFARLRLAELAELDRSIGRIWSHLSATGALADTVLMFWSDNGDSLLDHRMPYLGKGMPYDACARVPLVVAGAGVAAGVVDDTAVYGPDLTLTVLDLMAAGAGVPQDGRSLVEVAANPAGFTDRAVLGHCAAEFAAVPDTPPSDWVATATRKLVRYQEPVGGFVDPTDRFELYDLAADPGELVNLAWDPAWLAERDALEARLDSLLATGTG